MKWSWLFTPKVSLALAAVLLTDAFLLPDTTTIGRMFSLGERISRIRPQAIVIRSGGAIKLIDAHGAPEDSLDPESVEGVVTLFPYPTLRGFWAATSEVQDLRIGVLPGLSEAEREQIPGLFADVLEASPKPEWAALAAPVRAGTQRLSRSIPSGRVHNFAAAAVFAALVVSLKWRWASDYGSESNVAPCVCGLTL